MIRLEHVTKKFELKGNEVLAVNDVNLEIKKGEIFGIIGFSGAGKSTLVRCINLLEVPTEGSVYFDDVDLLKTGTKELRTYRQKIGMIFQHFQILFQLRQFRKRYTINSGKHFILLITPPISSSNR